MKILQMENALPKTLASLNGFSGITALDRKIIAELIVYLEHYTPTGVRLVCGNYVAELMKTFLWAVSPENPDQIIVSFPDGSYRPIAPSEVKKIWSDRYKFYSEQIVHRRQSEFVTHFEKWRDRMLLRAWTFLFPASGESFLSSDYPIVTVAFNDKFMGSFMPLTPSLGVLIHDSLSERVSSPAIGYSKVGLNKAVVNELNVAIARSADRYIVSQNLQTAQETVCHLKGYAAALSIAVSGHDLQSMRCVFNGTDAAIVGVALKRENWDYIATGNGIVFPTE